MWYDASESTIHVHVFLLLTVRASKNLPFCAIEPVPMIEEVMFCCVDRLINFCSTFSCSWLKGLGSDAVGLSLVEAMLQRPSLLRDGFRSVGLPWIF